ncbi:MmgE/PrpD family protein [Caballeronia choica]|uniref:MmgE/PrpD family protein n=1 Tax=Caballeronia choica TaxID=326476 RepID=A0A158KXQ2_9BURK|nr:MmgE/PrpD family protein [Caballeronia choica]SAL85519.1 MmgE/PrpD family protein [Caballeronia choica]
MALPTQSNELSTHACPPTDPNGPTGRLAAWLASVTTGDIPGHVLERAKHLTLDGIGCALVGAQLPWSSKAVELVCAMEDGGRAALIGRGLRTSAPAAALLNGTFIQGFELDDFHPLAPLHAASVVLPSLFATAELLGGTTGADFLLAATCGYEVGPRVGLALHGSEMLSRGWHSGAVFGTHASAAAAGKLRGLSAAAFEDALGLAGTQSGGLMAAQFEAMSKRMHHGFAARAGLYAATLAHGGYTGIKRVFEREYGGFLSTFGEGHAPDAQQVCGQLGDKWETEAYIIKPYAAMGALLAPIGAMLELRERRRFRPDDIETIELDCASAAFHHGGWQAERPLTPIGAQMNMAYAVAVAALDGAALMNQFRPERIDADDVWAFMSKIAVRHEPAFDADGPLARGAVRMRVTFADGSREEKLLRHPRGQRIEPMSNRGIVEKFRALTGGIVGPARQREIESLVLNVERLADVRELIDVLAPPVANAFA